MQTNQQNPDNSSHIQKHIEMLQGVINRMANNSASCKTWCITLVAALLATSFSGGTPNTKLIWVTVLPIITFAWLDAYYLHLEKEFTGIFKFFTKKIRDNTYTMQDLFLMKKSEAEENKKLGRGTKAFIGAFKQMVSPSVWVFYLLQLIAIAIIISQLSFC